MPTSPLQRLCAQTPHRKGAAAAAAHLITLALLIASGCGGNDAIVDGGASANADADADVTGADGAAGGADAAVDDDAHVSGDIQRPGSPCTTLADCGAALDPCQRWICDSVLGCVAAWAPADALCSPADPCATAGRCVGGACAVEVAKDCDDGDPCTSDGCKNGACVALPVEASAVQSCDDGDPCTASDHCAGGACVGGATTCACDSDADCAGLSGGDLCKGKHYCAVISPGVRACALNPATVVTCNPDADTACTVNTCDPATGACSLIVAPDAQACNDGDPCTAGEVCTKGVCGQGTPVCCKVDADCAAAEDGDLCNGTKFCHKGIGLCLDNPATVVSCPSVDDTACSQNLCDKKKGVCAMTAAGDGGFCDDGNPCTPGDGACKDGACMVATNTCACGSDADCASKDDGDVCNGTLYCEPSTGTCAPNPATVVLCPTVDDTACSKATCIAKTGACAAKPVLDGTPCEGDGTACTPNDTCQGGACQVDPANTCKCKTTADCTKYDDGDLCNGVMYCDLAVSACKVNPATVVSCPSADNTACLQSLCQKQTGTCAMTFVHQNELCDDGVPCTQGELCQNGACKGGTDVCLCHKDADCKAKEDGNVCNGTLFCDTVAVPWQCQVKPSTVITCPTVNDTACQLSSCQPLTGKCEIALQNTDGPCDDGDPCTGGTVCKGNLCLNPDLNAGKPCDDNNPCTDDTCEKDFGCLSVANKAPCEDGDACTAGDVCAGKQCLAGKAKSCNDGNICTTDLCDPKAGCVELQNASACSDGSACTLGDGCKAGACVAGGPKVCSDGDPCSVDGCDGKTGACTFDSKVAGALVCADSHACTKDSCDKVLGCQHVALAGACDDGFACTDDACLLGVGCVHLGADAACDDGSLCTSDSCITGAGCVHEPRPDGVACFDADACTVGDACKAGVCAPGTKAALCDVSTDQCQGKPDGTACNDGDACTKGEGCAAGVCAAPLVVALTSAWAGTQGVTGHRDGPRSLAQLAPPTAVVRTVDGAIVVAGGGVLRRVGLDGQVTTLAGGGNAAPPGSDGAGSAAAIGDVYGMIARADGSVVFADATARTYRVVAAAGVVSTLVGAGSKGFANGSGKQATFSLPADLVARPDGVLLLVDRDSYCLRTFDAKADKVDTFAGACGTSGVSDGPAQTARFHTSTAIAAVPGGDWVVVDRGTARLRRVTATGTVTTLAGSSPGFAEGKGTLAKFNAPTDVAVSPAGELYVADQLNQRVRRVLLDGSVSTLAGSVAGATQGANATFNQPSGLAFAPSGDLIVADFVNRLLRRIELRRHACDDGDPCTEDTCAPQSGTCSAAKVDCGVGNPCLIAACAPSTGACSQTPAPDGSPCDDGDPCTAPQHCGKGHCFAAGKLTLHSADGYGDQDGAAGTYRVNGVRFMRASPDGAVVFADTNNHVIRRLGADGVVLTIAGTSIGIGEGYADGPALQARFKAPTGLHLEADGAVVIADNGNARVRRLGVDGQVTTLAGGPQAAVVDGPAAVARFNSPLDLARNAQGDLIVSDYLGHRLRRLHDDGAVSTWAGSAGGHQDGPVAVARFYRPAGLARAADGSLFVADYYNHVVRKISPAGVVTTAIGRIGVNAFATGSAHEAALAGAYALTIDRDERLWIGTWGGELAVWTGGRLHAVVLGSPAAFTPGVGVAATLFAVGGLGPLPNGDLLVGDAMANRVGRLVRPLLGCDDGQPCTQDACLTGVGCKHVAAALPCDDGDACTVGDTCSASGQCKPGGKVAGCTCKAGPGGGCDDGEPCTVDSCEPIKGCGHAKRPDGSPCDDGNACSEVSQCLGGVCKPDVVAFSVTRLVGSQDGEDANGLVDGPRAATVGKLARAALTEPVGATAGPDGTLYWTEATSHTVRALSPLGVVRTLAGGTAWSGYNPGFADGHAFAARFNWPYALARAPSGVLFVADLLNHALRAIAPDGTVSTFAGGGPAAAGMTDGKGTSAKFNEPAGLALLGDGSIVVADSGNHRLRQVGADAAVTTLAGAAGKGFVDGPAATAKLAGPIAVAVGAAGELYVADDGNAALRRLRDGVVETLAGATALGLVDGPGVAGAGVPEPRALLYDAATGGVLITSMLPGRLRLWTPWGGVVSLLGDGGTTPKGGVGLQTTVAGPRGIAKLGPDTFAILESAGARIAVARRIGASCDDGNPCTADTCDPKVGCSHKAADPALACPDGGPCQIAACDVSKGACSYSLAPEGSRCGKGDDCASLCQEGVCRQAALVLHGAGTGSPGSADGPAAQATFFQPGGLTSDGAGGLLIADGAKGLIRRLDAKGAVTTVAGGVAGYLEGTGAAARFKEPNGLARAADGSVLIADSGNNRLRRLSPSYTSTLVAGSGADGFADGPATSAKFWWPRDVAIDAAGVIFVADYYNHLIRKVSVDGEVSTLAGGPGKTGVTDGVGAAARFSKPASLALAKDGALYVVDLEYNLLRRVLPNGQVDTIAGRPQAGGAHKDGHGIFGPQFLDPTSVEALADGSLLVGESNSTIRRVWPKVFTATIAGVSGGKTFSFGFGDEARFGTVGAIHQQPDGSVWTASHSYHRVLRLRLDVTSCKGLAGAAQALAAADCAAIGAQQAYEGMPKQWVDPNAGGKEDAVRTECDHTTAGGGWTRVIASHGDAFVKALLAGKGQMMRKCALDATGSLVSPASDKPFSFLKKTAVGGTWWVDGKPVACGAHASFDDAQCGVGWGCADGPGAAGNVHLPGMTGVGICSVPEAGYSTGALNVCGKADFTGWVTYLRRSLGGG